MQSKLGQKKFYNRLLKLDPLIKNVIEKNDVQRSIRAYEIKNYTKVSIINWFKKNRPKRVETIMGMNISNARDAYSNAKTAFKKSG